MQPLPPINRSRRQLTWWHQSRRPQAALPGTPAAQGCVRCWGGTGGGGCAGSAGRGLQAPPAPAEPRRARAGPDLAVAAAAPSCRQQPSPCQGSRGPLTGWPRPRRSRRAPACRPGAPAGSWRCRRAPGPRACAPGAPPARAGTCARGRAVDGGGAGSAAGAAGAGWRALSAPSAGAARAAGAPGGEPAVPLPPHHAAAHRSTKALMAACALSRSCGDSATGSGSGLYVPGWRGGQGVGSRSGSGSGRPREPAAARARRTSAAHLRGRERAAWPNRSAAGRPGSTHLLLHQLHCAVCGSRRLGCHCRQQSGGGGGGGQEERWRAGAAAAHAAAWVCPRCGRALGQEAGPCTRPKQADTSSGQRGGLTKELAPSYGC